MKSLLISAIALVAMMSQASLRERQPDQLAQRTIERRGRSAIWGMPASTTTSCARKC